MSGKTNKKEVRFSGLIIYAVLIFSLILGLSGGVSAACVGTTQNFECGDIITQSCTLNSSSTSTGTCFAIGADNITIDGAGYNINGDATGYGIYMNNRNNVTIKNFNIYTFDKGIYLRSSAKNTITKNTASSNENFGIHLYSSNNNNIENNTANSNFGKGIYLSSSSNNNNVINNTANSNLATGIVLYDSSNNNTITKNTADSNDWGILLDSSLNNEISKNTANNNEEYGIYINGYSNSNIINSNTFCDNDQSNRNYQDIFNSDSNSGDNNTCQTTYNWNDTGETGCTYSCEKPDISITSLDYAPQTPNTGDEVNITAIVMNAGNVPVTNINVSLFIDGVYENSKIISYLANNNEKEVNFTWTAAPGDHNITVIVDPNNEIDESNENNNELSVMVQKCMKGDIDCDSDIDFLDFVNFAMSYGTTCADPEYNSLADFDDDCDVDFLDFVNFARVY